MRCAAPTTTGPDPVHAPPRPLIRDRMPTPEGRRPPLSTSTPQTKRRRRKRVQPSRSPTRRAAGQATPPRQHRRRAVGGRDRPCADHQRTVAQRATRDGLSPSRTSSRLPRSRARRPLHGCSATGAAHASTTPRSTHAYSPAPVLTAGRRPRLSSVERRRRSLSFRHRNIKLRAMDDQRALLRRYRCRTQPPASDTTRVAHRTVHRNPTRRPSARQSELHDTGGDDPKQGRRTPRGLHGTHQQYQHQPMATPPCRP